MKKFLIKITLRLHNFLYRVISKLAIEKGIHKKHSLMNYHQFFVDNVSSSDFVLDVGCGNGFLSYDMAKKAEEVTGIDIERREIKFKRDNLRFIFSDALSYDFKDRFDVIVLSNVLEHIEKRQEFLTKIKKLAPKILIRVPMLNRDWISLYKKELGVEYRLDKGHFIEYTPESFKKEIEQAGLRIEGYSIQFGEIWAIIYDQKSF